MCDIKVLKEFNANTGTRANSQRQRVLFSKEKISNDDIRNFHNEPFKDDPIGRGIFEIASIIKVSESFEDGYVSEYRFYDYCD